MLSFIYRKINDRIINIKNLYNKQCRIHNDKTSLIFKNLRKNIFEELEKENLSSIFKISTDAIEGETAARVLNSTAIASETNAINLLSASKLKEMGVDNSRLTLMEGVRISRNGNLITTRALTEAEYEQLAVSLQQAGANEAQIASLLGLIEVQKLMTIADYQRITAEIGLTEAQAGQIIQALGLSVADGINLTTSKALTKQEILEALAHAGVADETTKEFLAKKLLNAQNIKNVGSSKLLAKAITLLKNPITWVVIALGTAIVAFNHFYDTAEETSKKVKELKDGFDSALKTANQNLKTIEGLADRYEELSDGVSDLGENVSLSTDEFEEYNNIVNQIADMSPELVKGYTAEGNAILSLKGKAEELTAVYKEAQKEAYRLLITSGKDADGNDILKQWTNLHDTDLFERAFDLGASDVGGDISTSDAIKQLEAIQNMSAETYRHIEKTIGSGTREAIASLSDIEKEIGYGSFIYKVLGIDENTTDEDFAEAKKQARVLVQKYNSEIKSALSDIESLANAYLMTNDNYDMLDEQSKNIASILVNSLNTNIANEFNNQEDVGAYVNDIVSMLANLSEVEGSKDAKRALINLFSLPTDKESINELKPQIDGLINTIASFLNEDPIELKVRLGFNNIDDIYNRGQNSIKAISENQTKSYQGLPPQYAKYVDNYPTLLEYTRDFNNAQWETWLNVTDGTMSATEAIEAFENAIENVEKEISKLSITDTVNNINKKLKPALDSLAGIYTTLFDKENGYEWQIIDVEEFASIKSELDSLKEEFGIDVPTEDYEEFVKILSGTSTTGEQAQQAFDDLATSMINNSNVVELTDENFDLLRNSLENLGITNANEVLENIRDAEAKLIDEGINLENVNLDLAQSFIEEAGAADVASQYLQMHMLKKHIDNANPLNTYNSVEALEKECKALKITGDLLDKTAKLKSLFYAAERNLGTPNILDEIEKTQSEINDLINNQYSYEFNFEYDGNTTGDNKDKSSSKDTKETFDWIETLISRIQRNITNLGKVVSATYRNWSTRNNALAQEMGEVNKEINAQMTAYNAYMQKANSVPLAEGYKELVRSGAYKISEITDEKLKEQIQEYEEWYNKALDASDAIEDLRANLAELAMTKFNNISEQYDDQISLITHHVSMLEGFVSQSEAAGYMASEVYYKAMAEKQQENIAQLQGEYSSLLSAFDEAVKSGSIEKYSSDWYEMLSSINDVELEIQSATTELIEFNQTLQQLSWEVFDKIQDSVSGIVEEANFLIDVLDSKDLHTDKGAITDEGLAVQGLHAVNYNTYMEQALAYADEMAKIEAEMANDPYDMELVERRNELLGLQQEAIQNAIDEKEAIRDLTENGFNKMLDSLQATIDKRKKLMSDMKSLYDYQKSISDQTYEIASLEKQFMAHSGNDSEAAKALTQQISVKLQSAKDSLKESEYDRYLSDMESMYDSFYDSTEEWVNQRLDNLDGLVAEAVDATNKNAETISNAINELSNSYGYKISDTMETIWDYEEKAIDGVATIVSVYGDILSDDNKTIANNIVNGTTNVVNAISGLNSSMQTMIGELKNIATSNANSIAQAQNAVVNQQNNSYPTNNAPSTPTITTTPTTSTQTTSGSGKNDTSTTKKYHILNQDGIIINSNLTEEEAKKIVSANGHRGWRMKAYAKGTSNAKRGLGVFGEAGDELLIANDGSILLSSGATLYPFQGGETVLNAKETAETLSNGLTPLSINDFSKVAPNMNGIVRNTNGNVTQDINVSFALPNVTDANSLITELQNNKRFEKVIQGMTADVMIGKNSLNKYKF